MLSRGVVLDSVVSQNGSQNNDVWCFLLFRAEFGGNLRILVIWSVLGTRPDLNLGAPWPVSGATMPPKPRFYTLRCVYLTRAAVRAQHIESAALPEQRQAC